MKTLILAFVMTLSFFTSGCAQGTFKDVSSMLSKYQLEKGLRSGDKDYYHEIRTKLIETNKLDVFEKFDTLFILEAYDMENANFYCEIWTSNKHLVYTYNRGSFNFDEESVYTAYTRKLIQEWNTEEIRREEQTNSTMTNPLQIYGSRILRNGEKFKIDCLVFKEFFLLERDR